MTIERIFYCDGPDCGSVLTGGKPAHVQTMRARPACGFLFITGTGGLTGRTMHFCSWDCVMKYAATFDPPVVIPFHEGSE